MVARGGTYDDEVWFGVFDAVLPIIEKLVVGELEGLLHVRQAVRIGITDPDHLAVRVLGCHSKVVSHVHMLKGDAGDSKFLPQGSVLCFAVVHLV